MAASRPVRWPGHMINMNITSAHSNCRTESATSMETWQRQKPGAVLHQAVEDVDDDDDDDDYYYYYHHQPLKHQLRRLLS